jgi:hypothetical protein
MKFDFKRLPLEAEIVRKGKSVDIVSTITRLILGIIAISLLTGFIAYLDFKILKLNGIITTLFIYTYISYLILIQRRRSRAQAHLTTLSLWLLALSAGSKNSWYTDLYLNLGATTIFVGLVDLFLLDTSQWFLGFCPC